MRAGRRHGPADGAYSESMTTSDAEQLMLDGLAPRKRRRRAPAERHAASERPIAQVVLDVQATHLGRSFDYLVDEKDSQAARPGVLVRVRFGGQRVTGVIWDRVSASDTPMSSIRYLDKVLSPDVLVPYSLRSDISLIAEAYGGTRANILRFAVPQRVAKVEAGQRLAASFDRPVGGALPNVSKGGFAGRSPDGKQVGGDSSRIALVAPSVQRGAQEAFKRVSANYADANMLNDALAGKGFRSFVFDLMPGAQEWARNMGWMIAVSLMAGKSAVVELPTMREVEDLLRVLANYGLQRFGPSAKQGADNDIGATANRGDGEGQGAAAARDTSREGASEGGWVGDVAVFNAETMPPAERYRTYLAVALGQVKVAIGTRAVSYAPVEGPAMFAIYEDAAYQNMDGMMPYPQARGVMRLRAKAHGGVFVAMANARTPISEWESESADSQETPVSGFSTAIRPLTSPLKDTTPWVRWLNREELARLTDVTIGSRVPHTAVQALTKALERGPVLMSLPQDGISETLSCANCHRQARCPRCAGPLMLPSDRHESMPRCGWCGRSAVDWTCPGCGHDHMRAVRVGAAGTAVELSRLFRRGTPMVLSSKTQGLARDIPCTPMLVVATPGYEPRVRPVSSEQGASGSEYQAVAILDAWTSLYGIGIDARLDTLTAWMRVVSMCAPRSRGGQALILGETDPVLAESLRHWDSRILAESDLEERRQTGMPPVVAAALVWGRRDAVMTLLRRIGAIGGDWSVCRLPDGTELPGMLGPVPMAPPDTVDARELEATADRVKAVVRVPQRFRAQLAARLHREVARHVAAREFGELRFRVDPKDLL